MTQYSYSIASAEISSNNDDGRSMRGQFAVQAADGNLFGVYVAAVKCGSSISWCATPMNTESAAAAPPDEHGSGFGPLRAGLDHHDVLLHALRQYLGGAGGTSLASELALKLPVPVGPARLRLCQVVPFSRVGPWQVRQDGPVALVAHAAYLLVQPARLPQSEARVDGLRVLQVSHRQRGGSFAVVRPIFPGDWKTMPEPHFPRLATVADTDAGARFRPADLEDLLTSHVLDTGEPASVASQTPVLLAEWQPKGQETSTFALAEKVYASL